MAWSEVYDPLPGLIKWLEHIIKGISTRLFIDEEGKFHELISYAKEPEQIRFLIIKYHRGKETQLDVIIPKKLVIEKFYKIPTRVNSTPSFLERWTSKGTQYKSDFVRKYLET